jgi:UDP-2,3-diacylglucosamine pyrophosphatase LpxH
MENLTGQKVVIISDLHLGGRFNQAKFELIQKAIQGGDKLIINGDLWEGFDITFEQFLASGWRQLFPLFKEKKAVYLTGNHDPLQANPATERFAVQTAKKYQFSQNDAQFLVIHGDLFEPNLDLRHPNLPRWLLSLGSKFERLVIKLFGRNYLKFYLQSNKKMKNWRRAYLDPSVWLICGHSHLAEINQADKYANSGIFLASGLASYLVVEDGAVRLVRL